MLPQLEVQRIKWLFIEKMTEELKDLLEFKKAFEPVRKQARADADAGEPRGGAFPTYLAMWQEINRELEATVGSASSELRVASLRLAQAECLSKLPLGAVPDNEWLRVKLPHFARAVGVLFSLTRLRPNPPEFCMWNLQLVSDLELCLSWALLDHETAEGKTRWLAAANEIRTWSNRDSVGQNHPTFEWLESWHWQLSPLVSKWEDLLASRGVERRYDGQTAIQVAFGCHAFWWGLEKTIEALRSGATTVSERDVLGYLDFNTGAVKRGFELAQLLAPRTADASEEHPRLESELGPLELLSLFSKGYSEWWRRAFEAIAQGQYDVAAAFMSRLLPSAALSDLLDDFDSLGYVP